MSVLFSYAFRPFFLGLAAFGIVAVAVWVAVLYGAGPATLPVNVVHWHAHEMLVGFVLAAVAGFLLTAVATWTNRPPVAGAELLLLFVLWVLGRVAFFFDAWLGAAWVALLDMLFPLLLWLLMAREVLGAANVRNVPIVWLCALLVLCNLAFHAGRLGLLGVSLMGERTALFLLLQLFVLCIAIIGGRIIPNFTANWLRARGAERLPVTRPVLERVTLLATVLTGAVLSVAPGAALTGALALLTGILHALRLAGWRGWQTRTEPLLFVLHLGYAWLPIAYGLVAAAGQGWLPNSGSAVHAFAVGCISVMILGVSTRVALAHTGRALRPARLTVAAYLLMVLAALARVANPGGASYFLWLELAAGLWIAAFASFLWVYAPVLTGPQVAENGD